MIAFAWARETWWVARYGVAVAAVLGATALSMIVRPVTHATGPIFVAAVMFGAWFGGMGPGLVATALSTLALDWVVERTHASVVLSYEVVARLSIFVLVALFIGALETARGRAEDARRHLLLSERQARAEAEAANRTKDEFVTMVAHELRTPLTGILSWTVALSGNRLDAVGREKALDAIQRNARLQARIIGDLVDLSRVARGQVSLEVAPMDLRKVIQTALETVAPAATAQGIGLMMEAEAPFPQVDGDAVRLQQVISNLVINAIKHSQRGDTVRVEVQAVGSEARIEVRDEGCGIASELLPYIFDRFRQADSAIARSGLGLGLTIVQALVELHGGRVEAASEGVGRGARFTVILPLRQAARPVTESIVESLRG